MVSSRPVGSLMCAFLLFVLSYARRSPSTSRSLFHGINKQESANTETGKLWVMLVCSCKQYTYPISIPSVWKQDPAFNTDNTNGQSHSASQVTSRSSWSCRWWRKSGILRKGILNEAFGVWVHKEIRKSRETTVTTIDIVINLRFPLGSFYRRHISMTAGPWSLKFVSCMIGELQVSTSRSDTCCCRRSRQQARYAAPCV